MNAADHIRCFEGAFAATDLVLYAGTNLHCPLDGSAGSEQAGMMPVIGAGAEKQQPNVASLVEIERIASWLLCDLFRGRFAEARFHSCTQANLAVFIALLSPGDTVMCLAGRDGGHVSQNGEGMLAHLAVQLLAIPFDAEAQRMDDAATAALVRNIRPRIVIFGPSVVIRPSDMTLAAAACREAGATLVVDVSHVAGLIAGGAFPNPLEHGADLITASSYKTLGCPPAGFIVGRDPRLQSRIESAASPKLLSNYDSSRLLRFTTALADSRAFLGPYATATVANAAALRAALLEQGLTLLTPGDRVFGTHQVIVRAEYKEIAVRGVNRLQQSGISTSLCGIPGRPGQWGIRLGTQLVTRRGMGMREMTRIAATVASAIRGKSQTELRQEVAELVSGFPRLAYCAQPAPGHEITASASHGQ